MLWSDHMLLEIICKKPLATAPKHLQRLLLQLQQYDIEIRYKPGPEMYLVDTLSRAYLPTTARSPTEEEMEWIHAVEFLPTSEPQLAEISVKLQQTQYYSGLLNIARLARSERSPTLRITSLLHCKRWAYCTGWNPLQRFKICNTSYLEAQNTQTTSCDVCVKQSTGLAWMLAFTTT